MHINIAKFIRASPVGVGESGRFARAKAQTHRYFEDPCPQLSTQSPFYPRTRARERPREHSYAHARVEWADGTVREGWLRTGEGGDFTAAVAAEVARRALGRGMVLAPGVVFSPSGSWTDFLRFNVAHCAEPRVMAALREVIA